MIDMARQHSAICLLALANPSLRTLPRIPRST
jgi:hypothetical protein